VANGGNEERRTHRHISIYVVPPIWSTKGPYDANRRIEFHQVRCADAPILIGLRPGRCYACLSEFRIVLNRSYSNMYLFVLFYLVLF
jgi:hypothetical protein